MTKEEYFDVLNEFRIIAKIVYKQNREEINHLENTFMRKYSMFVWFFSGLTVLVMFVSEAEILVSNYTCQKLVEFMLIACCCLIIIGNIINKYSQPPKGLFTNIETMFRSKADTLLKQINFKFETKGIRFNISNNDIMWIEIFIPKHLQMPFSPYQIQRQAKSESNKLKSLMANTTAGKMVLCVDTQREADRIN